MKHILLFTIIILYLIQPIKSQSISKLDTIINTKIEPFSQVCYQEIYRVRKGPLKNRPYQSTGFLIAPNIILTAAHNLYSDKWTKVTNIKIFPGRYNNEYSYDSIEISGEKLCQYSIKWHPKFYWNKVDYDFGIIIIPDSIIKKAKNWPSKSCFVLDTAFQLKKGDTINVAGFPASHGYNGSLMTFETQLCGDVKNKSLAHEFDTQTGNSGSPIWVESNGQKKIVGVHTYALAGTKIDTEYVKLILNWIQLH